MTALAWIAIGLVTWAFLAAIGLGIFIAVVDQREEE